MGNRPLETGRRYLLRLATREVECEVVEIERIVDSTDLDARESGAAVGRNEVADLVIRTKAPLAFDRYADFEVSGRFVLVDQYDVAGGGIIAEAVEPTPRPHALSWDGTGQSLATEAGRAKYSPNSPALVVLVGSDGSTEAVTRALEARLAERGYRALKLDCVRSAASLGADVTAGASADAARRFRDLAALMLDGGLVVVACTPSLSDVARDTVGTRIGAAPVLIAQVDDDRAANGATSASSSAALLESLIREGVIQGTAL
jgi:bifunctional enzyme CysN/CysC